MKSFAGIFVSALLLISAAAAVMLSERSRASSGDVQWHGPITRALPGLLDREGQADRSLVIASMGGSGLSALAAAEFIRDRRMSLVVDGHCMSACVDFLFAAASHVDLGRDAVVGLHGNFVADSELAKAAFPGQAICFPDSADRLRRLWHATGVQADSWSETTNRLVVLNVPEPKGVACSKPLYRHSWWYPTRSQLEGIFGRKFVGTLCADDPVCVNMKIRYQFSNISVVVGDRVFFPDGKAVEAPAWQ